MFIHCGYWGNWARVLSDSHPMGPFIEVDLTPVSSAGRTWKNDVAPIHFRAHCTARDIRADGGDLLVEQLPEEVKRAMIKNLGAALTERLLTEDFLPQIDWGLYRQKCNGGANLEDIHKR